MSLSNIAGFPRIGPNRELKFAAEGYWRGETSADQLDKAASEIRRANWELMQAAGIDLIPSNDFSLYDQVLDAIALVGAVPERYGHRGGPVGLDTYFAMARGRQAEGVDVTAMEMTKWFDTNYHYIVPELERGQSFRLASSKPVNEFREAKALGIDAVPVLVGPVTFLLLAKAKGAKFDRLSLLDALLPVYADAITALVGAGATWVQMDEPALALDRTDAERAAFVHAYEELSRRVGKAQLLVATYFAGLDDNLSTALALPVQGLHVDLVRAPQQLDPLLKSWPKGRVLSAGVIDGRDGWGAGLRGQLGVLDRAAAALGKERLWVGAAPSL